TLCSALCSHVNSRNWTFLFFFKQKTAYEIGLGIPAEPLFRSKSNQIKLVKDFLKVRCRLALLPFLISCLIWLDLVASLPLIKERSEERRVGKECRSRGTAYR